MNGRLVTLSALVVGLLLGAYLMHLLSMPSASVRALDKYLLAAAQDLVRQSPESRVEYLQDAAFFNDLTQDTNLSKGDQAYYWFAPSRRTAAAFGIADLPDEDSDFHGFYVVLTQEGDLADFGYHKP